ncbi:Fur family transcriptional regulator [Haliangium sp.]|uniref:Fur family transcriptional regulator n=1 Tax=Haliangium sp. TaxID=2663208 RepID=UPI003D10A622
MRTHRNSAPAAEAGVDQALASFQSFLHRRSLRVTPVREAILRAALRRQDHFRVEDLVDDIRRAGGAVSVATVYRAIPLLVEAGIVEPTEVSGDGRCYETAFGREHHDHLICRECRRVVEFHFEAFEMLQREVAAKYGFLLTDHVHELIGVCGDCRQSREAQSPD